MTPEIKKLEKAAIGGALLGAGTGLVASLTVPLVGAVISGAVTGALIQSTTVSGITPTSVGTNTLVKANKLRDLISRFYYTSIKIIQNLLKILKLS